MKSITIPGTVYSSDIPFGVSLMAEFMYPEISAFGVKIKIFIPPPNIPTNKPLLVKKSIEEKQAIIARINKFETKTFEIVSSAKNADFTFPIDTIVKMYKGKACMCMRTRWSLTKRGKKIHYAGLKEMKKRGISIKSVKVNNGYALGRKDVTEYGEIIEATGFVSFAIYTTIFKSLININ